MIKRTGGILVYRENNYKFLNNEFEFKKERIGEIKRYLKSQLCETKEEAERIIN